MRITNPIVLSLAFMLFSCTCARAAQSSTLPCTAELTRSIPDRGSDAPSGAEFEARVSGNSEDEREAKILSALLNGNMPQFLRKLQPVHMRGPEGSDSEITVCVLPDYLAIGSDDDFMLAPMRLQTAIEIAGRFHFTLPTRRIVDAVYSQAKVHLQPEPMLASGELRSTAYYSRHNRMVREQRLDFADDPGALIAGDKKDLILTNQLWTNLGRVAIYGWHRLNGRPIQPLSTVHGIGYADYSHGVRLVSDTAYIKGQPVSLLTVMRGRQTAVVVSDEGEINAAALLERLRSKSIPAVPLTAGTQN